MLSKQDKETLEKQQYRMVGSHSTVKVCGWTKQILRGEGGCYKFKFYGINTLQCLQMSTCLSCANRCIFCWRDYKASVSPSWIWDLDSPEFIFDNSLVAQKKLLEGFGGNDQADQEAYTITKTVRHVALSLTGEPILYPKLNEFISLCHSKKISTFLVTNGQYPQQIADIKRVTQLYLSMDATTPEMMKKISKPLFVDYWDRWERSLDEVAKKDFRKAVRITLIKGLNDDNQDLFAKMITRCDADIIEIKAYMHVGASQERLKRCNMPHHCDVVSFALLLNDHLDDYAIVSEHLASKVVLLVKKNLYNSSLSSWNTWIDFEAFFLGEKNYNAPMPKECLDFSLDNGCLLSQSISSSVYEDSIFYFKKIKELIDKEKCMYLPLAFSHFKKYSSFN
jgi:tRNA wybutosine-synthesizing protein 1